TLRGPTPGQHFPLAEERSIIGRQSDSTVCLESPAVSRQHAQISCDKGGRYFIEDLGSSNGTFLNGVRLKERTPLSESDNLQIGPYLLALRLDQEPVVRATVNATVANASLFVQNPAYKLQVVLEIAEQLGCTLDMD